jgi:hypothetical protein
MTSLSLSLSPQLGRRLVGREVRDVNEGKDGRVGFGNMVYVYVCDVLFA